MRTALEEMGAYVKILPYHTVIVLAKCRDEKCGAVFYSLLWARSEHRGPQFGKRVDSSEKWSAVRNFLARCKSGAASRVFDQLFARLGSGFGGSGLGLGLGAGVESTLIS